MVPLQIPDQIPHQSDLIRIQSDRGFVQNQQIRLMHHRIRQPDPLSVAFRAAPDDHFLHSHQPAQFQPLPHPLVHPSAGNAFERGPVAEILVHPHVRIERHILRQIPDVLAGPERFAKNIPPGHFRVSRGRRQKACQHLHRRAFARTIRPEKPHDLAFGDLKINRVHGFHLAVTFGELFHFDHRASPSA